AAAVPTVAKEPATTPAEPATPTTSTDPDPLPTLPAEPSTSTANASTDKGKGRALPTVEEEPDLPLHPFARLDAKNRYVPPTTKNMGVTDKRTDPAYRTQAPIVANLERTKNIFERCLDSKITVSVEEICSIAPDIRGKFRDAVTPKRVTAAEPVVTAMATVEDVNEIEDALVPAVQSFAIYPAENTPHIDTAYIEDMDDLPDLLYPEETPTASTSTEIPTTFGLRNGALVVPDPYDIYL
ncbi:hypothetical protein H0H93_000572, partial [Arthromyces matolae]